MTTLRRLLLRSLFTVRPGISFRRRHRCFATLCIITTMHHHHLLTKRNTAASRFLRRDSDRLFHVSKLTVIRFQVLLPTFTG